MGFKCIDYPELTELVQKVEYFLEAKNVKKGDAVAVAFKNPHFAFWYVLLGMMLRGITAVPILHSISDSGCVEHILKISKICGVITDSSIPRNYQKFPQVWPLKEIQQTKIPSCPTAPTSVRQSDHCLHLYADGMQPSGMTVTYGDIFQRQGILDQISPLLSIEDCVYNANNYTRSFHPLNLMFILAALSRGCKVLDTINDGDHECSRALRWARQDVTVACAPTITDLQLFERNWAYAFFSGLERLIVGKVEATHHNPELRHFWLWDIYNCPPVKMYSRVNKFVVDGNRIKCVMGPNMFWYRGREILDKILPQAQKETRLGL